MNKKIISRIYLVYIREVFFMKIFILGNDSRSVYLKEMYNKSSLITEDIYSSEFIITAIPFTKDNKYVNTTNLLISDLISVLEEKKIKLISGNIPLSIIDELTIKKVEYFDILRNEEVAIKNAIPSAEGAILSALSNSNITLNSSNILIMGFGKIGKILANMLRGFGANIYVEARKESDLAFIKAYGYKAVDLQELNDYLYRFDFIFNTIPYVILDEKKLKLIKNDALIVDIASSPGGVDYKKAKELNINVDWALSLPTKVAPKTAANYLKENIDKIILNKS